MSNIKEIAKTAGVSITTVSRVINNHSYVKDDKRRAVLEAIEQLNYSRNMNALHLVRGKTNMVGVMLPKIYHDYFSRLLEGISNEALRQNYQLILCQTDYKAEKEMEILNLLRMKQIDGIIICSKTLGWEEIVPYTKYGPILACEETENDAISSVYIDHYACFKSGLKFLMEKGHTNLGFCVGRQNSDSTRQRTKAYTEMVSALGQSIRREWMFYECYSIESGTEVVRKWLSMEERPTALLVSGDQVAAGIIMEVKKNGLRVPEDLAIIGFDNQPIAKVFDLTTIDNQLFEMGSTAFRIVHDRIVDKKKDPESHELLFRLVERSTV